MGEVDALTAVSFDRNKKPFYEFLSKIEDILKSQQREIAELESRLEFLEQKS